MGMNSEPDIFCVGKCQCRYFFYVVNSHSHFHSSFLFFQRTITHKQVLANMSTPTPSLTSSIVTPVGSSNHNSEAAEALLQLQMSEKPSPTNLLRRRICQRSSQEAMSMTIIHLILRLLSNLLYKFLLELAMPPNVGLVGSWTAVYVDFSCSKRHVLGCQVGCGWVGPLLQDESGRKKRGYIWCAIGGVSFSCFDAVTDSTLARCDPCAESVRCGCC